MVWSSTQLTNYVDKLIPEMVTIRGICNEKSYRDFHLMIIDEHGSWVIDYCLDKIILCLLDKPDEEHQLFETAEEVGGFFVNLCNNWPFLISARLSHSEKDKRLRILMVLKGLFNLQHKYPHITVGRHIASISSIWEDFLACFQCSDKEIRKLCIQIGRVLLTSETSYKIVVDIRKALTSRLLDIDYEVRIEAMVAVERIAQVRWQNVCNMEMLRNFATRVGDKSFTARTNAFLAVGNTYQHLVETLDVKVMFVNHIFKLASACLILYPSRQTVREKIWIESIFQRFLFGFEEPQIQFKVRNLFHLVMFSTNDAFKSIVQMFFSHKRNRDLLFNVVYLIYSGKDAKLLQKHCKEISKHFPNPKVLIQKLQKVQNNVSLARKLKDIFYPTGDGLWVNDEQTLNELVSRNAQESFDFANGQPEDEDEDVIKELVMGVCFRCGLGLIDKGILIAFINEISSKPPEYSIRFASFLILLTQCYPQYFKAPSIVTESLLNMDVKFLEVLTNESVLPKLQLEESFKEMLKNKVR